MTRRLRLPDFGKYFHIKSPGPVDFTCRTPPNLFHDLVFLKSYIHDARFRIERMRFRGKTLQISMERDRWERYEHLGKLESIFCELTIRPVVSIAWEFKGKLLRKGILPREKEFAIRDVYLGESYWDNSGKGEIIVSGHGRRPSKLRIAVSDPF
jgi:hypothetical protein